MVEHSASALSHHEQWVARSRIPEGDRSVREHEVLYRMVDAFATRDQVNVPGLLGCELLCRRLQVIKEAHRVTPSAPDYSAADHFMGWGSRAYGAAVSPELASHVATQLKTEAEILKEGREARE